MDLRSGNAVWTSRAPLELSRGPMTNDVDCDVLVVGTGITGALAAHALAEAGRDVVMIDQRQLARGSTSASTALIQYELDVPLVDLVPRLGRTDAESAYRQTRGALDALRDLVEREHIDCDLRQRPTLFLGHDADDVELLRREAAARQALGLECAFLDADALLAGHGIARPAAIRSSVSYELDPWKLTVGLLESVVRRGARIFDQTGLAIDGAPSVAAPLETTAGGRVRCGDVVFATGYDAPAQFPALRALCELKTTFALITEPVNPARLWPERALLWEHAAPYFYARTAPGNRVMIGGEDEPLMTPATRDAALPQKRARLLDAMGDLWPALRGVAADRSWGATFAETADGLPFIGSPDGAAGCHFALGYGGNGITFSLIAAGLIRDAIRGNADVVAARPFRFDRPSARFA